MYLKTGIYLPPLFVAAAVMSGCSSVDPSAITRGYSVGTDITAGHLDNCALGAPAGLNDDLPNNGFDLRALTSPQGLRCSDAALSLLKEPEHVIYTARVQVTSQNAETKTHAASKTEKAASENKPKSNF